MNLASILPCATVRSTGGASSAASAAAPAGFLAVLAARTTVAGEVLPLDSSPLDTPPADGTSPEGDVPGDGGAGAAQDLLTLAALAARTAHAALPQVLSTEGLPGEAEADETRTAVAPAVDGTSATDVATEDLAVDTAVAASELDAPAPADARAEEPGAPVDVAADPVGAERAQSAADAELPPSEAGATADDAAAAPAARPTGAAATGRLGAPDAVDGGEVPTAQRVAAAPATPSERQRGRADATPARTGVDGTRAVDGDAATAPTAPGYAAPAAGRGDALTPSSAAQRVLDLVSQLEDAPPPRVVVIETGEIRLRVGLDAGTVRLTVLGPLGQGGEEILRETTDALEAGGFGTELDRGTGEGRGEGRRADDRDVPRPASGAVPARAATRSRSGIQL